MAHVGVAPLTLVRTNAGRMEYVYAGQVAPEGIVSDDLDRLVADGYLEEVDDVQADDADEEPDESDAGGGPERPKAVANKATWAEYRGLTAEQAEGVTVDQLKDDEFMASFQPPAPEQN